MADVDGVVDDVFVYMGGNQVVPRNVRYVRIHKSVKIITLRAFNECIYLVSMEMHDGVEIIENSAFEKCTSLRSIKLTGVRIIGDMAFRFSGLESVKFGDKLEIIGEDAFIETSLRNIKIPKVREINYYAFLSCEQLIDVELSEDLDIIKGGAFGNCPRLRRIALPLKDNLLPVDLMMERGAFYEVERGAFYDPPDIIFGTSGRGCPELSRVDLVGGIHKSVSSLYLQSWRNEMIDEIDRINRVLPNTHISEKTTAIQQWMERVLRRIEHYKSEHYSLLEKATSQLELALWKTKLLDETFGEVNVGTDGARTTRGQWKRARLESRQVARVTCGADIIIKNVVPFLKLE
jgi:hypothetical protein